VEAGRFRGSEVTLIVRVSLLALAIAFASGILHGSDACAALHDAFVDPQDHAFDVSEWLLDRRGFLPVPIVVTEPAVGYGGGVAVVFFRESIRDAAAKSPRGKHVTPPDIYGGAFAATENGTTFSGAFAMQAFAHDRWRYRGAVAHTDAFIRFYPGEADLATQYELEGWLSSQQILLRLGDSEQYLAARWIYLDIDARIDEAGSIPIPEGRQTSTRSSGLGASWEYDTRDNIFTPNRGVLSALEGLFYEPTWGSDDQFQVYRAHVFAYAPLRIPLVVAGRLDGRMGRGDVPFYQLPFIDLRGIPVARYQGQNVAIAETELRWNVTPRWALMAFLGAGRAWGQLVSFEDAHSQVAGGTGFRYLLARRLGLYAGADVAWGPEDHAFYLQVGSAWR
jgi:Omp85 superfamily domain